MFVPKHFFNVNVGRGVGSQQLHLSYIFLGLMGPRYLISIEMVVGITAIGMCVMHCMHVVVYFQIDSS